MAMQHNKFATNSSTSLTQREQDVLNALLAGHTRMKDIGRQINIDWRTVQTHLRHLFKKTNTDNCTELVLWAWRNGWRLPN
jgi:DNA-binding NarL/FixJ family response regulator